MLPIRFPAIVAEAEIAHYPYHLIHEIDGAKLLIAFSSTGRPLPVYAFKQGYLYLIGHVLVTNGHFRGQIGLTCFEGSNSFRCAYLLFMHWLGH
jgi:hypothetical protein